MNEEKWKKSWAIKLDYELFLNSVESAFFFHECSQGCWCEQLQNSTHAQQAPPPSAATPRRRLHPPPPCRRQRQKLLKFDHVIISRSRAALHLSCCWWVLSKVLVGVCMKYASFYGDTLVKSVMQNLSRFYTACNPPLSSAMLQGDRILLHMNLIGAFQGFGIRFLLSHVLMSLIL
jgi:hypothetical protein